MHSVTHHHTFGLTASVNNLIILERSEQLVPLLPALRDEPYWILGEGSNCAFVDDYQGSILKLCSRGIEVQSNHEEHIIRVQGGENWHQFVVWCLHNGFHGLENLALIPGTVGAAPIQNIGAYGVEVEQFIRTVTGIELDTGRKIELQKSECQFAYRDSIFKGELASKVLVTEVEFALPTQWQGVTHYGELQALNEPSAEDIFNRVMAIRRSKLPDPEVIGNAGSFFKNPIIARTHYDRLKTNAPDLPCYPVSESQVKLPAAWLIDRLGFKGTQVGGIACHSQQALVLTNDGTGTGEQLLTLARDIKHKVAEVYEVELENEVRLLGSKGLVTL